MTGTKHFPVWGLIFTLFGVTILCGLGTWQLQRLAWKNDIIKQLNTAYEGETAAFAPVQLDGTGFAYGSIKGTFLSDKALLLGPKTKGDEIGHHLIVPLALKGPHTLLVNMGWTDTTDVKDLPIHHVKGKSVQFEGLARQPDWNSFTPPNSPENNVWTKPDITEIAAAKDLPSPLPVMLYAESASYKFDAAFPNNERWYPRNKHLQYALFWYTMAVALLTVFIIYVRGKKS